MRPDTSASARCRSSTSRPPSASSRWDCPYPLAFLIVGVALLLIAGVCAGIGYMMIKKIKAPERTIAQANKTVAEVKDAAQRALAAANAPQIEGTVVPNRAIR